MRKTISNKHMIRFRKWSRKAYAMFASIGKCVTIGNVKKGIVEASLGKQGNICASPDAWNFLSDYTEEKEEDSGQILENEVFLPEQLNNLQTVAGGIYLELLDMIKICRTGMYSPSARFFCIKTIESLC